MELLNGKAKELFEKWIINQKSGHDSQRMVKIHNQKDLFVSYVGIGKTLLNALIIEWLDSVGYRIGIDAYYDPSGTFRASLGVYGFQSNDRQQATTEAIKKAITLINKSNGK